MVPRAGNSTKTMSPRTDCAWSVIETVPIPVESSKATTSCSAVYRFASWCQTNFSVGSMAIHTDKSSKKLWSA